MDHYQIIYPDDSVLGASLNMPHPGVPASVHWEGIYGHGVNETK